MKKIVSIMLVVLLVTISFSACGGNSVTGTYQSESGVYKITLDNKIAKWYEDGNFYEGEYTVDGDNITLEIKGEGLTINTVFSGTVNGDTITLTGGALATEGENFIKQ